VGAQAVEDVIHGVDDERERGMPGLLIGALGAPLVPAGVRNVDSSTPAVAVRSLHDGEVHSDAVQPDEPVHPLTRDCCLALQLQAQFDEEHDRSREILYHNAHVIHPVDRHATAPPR